MTRAKYFSIIEYIYTVDSGRKARRKRPKGALDIFNYPPVLQYGRRYEQNVDPTRIIDPLWKVRRLYG
jgi:hypothetical protein